LDSEILTRMVGFAGYECPHGNMGSYDSVSTIGDLMTQYGIDDPKWKLKDDKTYQYGDGHKTMIPHPDYARREFQPFL
jgi:hypothetical protein